MRKLDLITERQFNDSAGVAELKRTLLDAQRSGRLWSSPYNCCLGGVRRSRKSLREIAVLKYHRPRRREALAPEA